MNISPIQHLDIEAQRVQDLVVREHNVTQAHINTTEPQPSIEANHVVVAREQESLSLAMFADVVTVSAGLAGVYLANRTYIPRAAGIFMALPVGLFIPFRRFLPSSKVFDKMLLCFLSGVVGSKNYKEFVIGYLVTNAVCKTLGYLFAEIGHLFARGRVRNNVLSKDQGDGFFGMLSRMFDGFGDMFRWQSLEPTSAC